MTRRRRKCMPMTLMALLDDSKLLLEAPATTTAGIDHFETTNLRTVLMTVHKESRRQITKDRQADCAGCLRRIALSSERTEQNLGSFVAVFISVKSAR